MTAEISSFRPEVRDIDDFNEVQKRKSNIGSAYEKRLQEYIREVASTV